MKPRAPQYFPIAIAAALLVLASSVALLPGHGWLDYLEGIVFDARVKFAAKYPKPSSTNLATLFLDNVAFERMNDGAFGVGKFTWPWPRFVHGLVVRELKAQGATAVGFDILFPESHPRDESTDWPLPDGKLVGSDDFFAMQIKNASNVVLAAENEILPAAPFLVNAVALGSVDSEPDYGVLRRVKPFTEMQVWHEKILDLRRPFDLDLSAPDFSQPAKIVFPTFDGKTHEVALLPDGTLDLEALGGEPNSKPERPFRTKRIWNFGIVLAAQALRLDLDKAEIERDHVTLRGPDGTERVIPLDQDGTLYIDWSLKWEDVQKNRLSVYAGVLSELILQDNDRQKGEKDLGNPFKDKLVVVGSVAAGNNITDKGATPLEEHTVLVTKHLNVANSVLMNRFVHPPSAVATLMALFVLWLFSITLSWRPKVVTAIGMVFVIAVLYITFCFWLYVSSRYFLPVVLPVGGGLLLPHFGMVAYRLIFEQKEQRRIKAVFNKIVSPEVVTELLSVEKLALGGARREVSVYFADVRGFTEFTDNSQANADEFVQKNGLSKVEAEAYFDKQASETLATVNLYLGTIADVVKAHQGTLDKYIGDCVMAFWGAPTPNPNHAVAAVRAAIDAQRALASLNQKRFAENERRRNENINRLQMNQPPLPLLPILNLGSGVNSGMVTVGLMGSDAHILNYTVFGREVNIAARLESVAKRGSIIISEETYQQIAKSQSEFASLCMELPSVSVKGIRQSIKIYEVMWKKSAGPTDVLTEDFNTVRFAKPSTDRPEPVRP